MNCDDVRHGIYVYLDREFAPPEERDFERHLEGCPSCRALAESEASFLRDFRESLVAPPMPEHLRKQIEVALVDLPAESTPRVNRWSVWRAAVPLAAAAAMAALIVWSVSLYGQAQYPLVNDALEAHKRNPPMEIHGSPDQIRDFLQGHVPFAVQVPQYERGEVRVVGARLTVHNGRPAVLYNLEVAGKRVSMLQAAAEEGADEDGIAPVLEDKDGFKVVTFRHRGLANSVVGNIGSQQMRRVVPVSFKR